MIEPRPLRVAMIMGKMIGGGVESVVMNYYRFIDRDKIQFDFIIDSDSTQVPRTEIEKLGGRIYEIPPYQNIFKYLKSLDDIFKNNNYRVVHSHINALSVFPLSVAKKNKIPVRIAHSHSTASRGEYKKNILKNVLRPFSKVAPTHYMAPTIHASKWLFGEKNSKDKTFILKNAIDVQKFSFNRNIRNELRNKYGYDDNDFIIGNVGRFVWQKNQEFLLYVFKEVLNEIPSAKLILVGDGPLKKNLLNLAVELNIKDYVFFINNSTNVEDMYQILDYFVFPSNYEGLGIVAIEAQIMGLPTLCSDRVPREVEVTNLCMFLSLDIKPREWAKYIIDTSQKFKNNSRVSKKSDIQFNNYDIECEANKLADIYIELGEG